MTINRREFLVRSLAGMAALGVPVSADNVLGPGGSVVKDGMLHRTLGKTGITLPIVSMGVMNARDPALIRKAYESGIRHFDTAAAYGNGRNEAMLGTVIREMGIRNRVTVATKMMTPNLRRGLKPNEAKAKCIESVEASLGFLKMDCVDIVYLHDVSIVDDLLQPGIPDAISKLIQDGKVRFGGFTTHQNMAACLDEAVRHPFYSVVLTSFNYSLAGDGKLMKSLAAASEKGIGLIAMKTQCGQYWYKQQLPEAQQKYYSGTIVNSAVLKWVLRHPAITTAVPGVTAFQHIDEDISAARSLEYTPEEASFLKERNIQTRLGVCRQCRYCVATCPKRVDIPALMRSHMYANCYANPELASETLRGIPDGRGLTACVDCAGCRAACRHAVDVAGRIRELNLAGIRFS